MSLPIERRRVLKLLGLGTAAAMPTFRPGRMAAAAESPVPKRFFAALMFNGVQQQGFWPQTNANEAPLADMKLPKALEPLEPFKAKTLVIRGLTNAACISPGGSHTRGHTGFSGFLYRGDSRPPPGAVTIDQHIADKVGAASKFKSLQFGTIQLPGYGSMFTAGSGGLPLMSNPKAAFDRVFGGFAPTGGTGASPVGPDPAELEALRLERKSVFDHISKDLSAVAARLSGQDRQRLEAHLTSIREIEKRLSDAGTAGGAPAGGGAACGKPNVTYQSPACQFKANVYDPRNDPACRDASEPITKNSLDILAAAFACDLTRVGSFQWGGTASGETYSWILGAGGAEGHHELSHKGDGDTANQDKLVLINRWHQEALAAFYAKLQAYTQADGKPLLDHFASYFTSEIGKGNSHQITDMPVIIVGGAGGYFRTGRYINVKAANLNQNDVLVSLANAFGSNVTTYGTAELCKGPLAGLT